MHKTSNKMLDRIKRISALVQEISSLPSVTINLMHGQTLQNDIFYRHITKSFYRTATKPHRRFPLIRAMEYGVALCHVTPQQGWYLNRIDSSGRRNVKKAQRLGYAFSRFDYNDHRADITAIHRSTDTRQGRRVPDGLLNDAPEIHNAASCNNTHDYPYFGVFNKEGRLTAYISCLIAGEICAIETIYGHAEHQSDGIVPLLLVSVADHLITHHSKVRYFSYGTYYGASETLKRFKRKFLFHPHRVKWTLHDTHESRRQ